MAANFLHMKAMLRTVHFMEGNSNSVPSGQSSAVSARRVSSVALLILITILSLAAFAVAAISGGIGDYSMYLVQWHAQASTGNPWPTEFRGMPVEPNAYGPLHALLGYMFQANWLLPKAILAGSPLLLFAILVWDRHTRAALSWGRILAALAIFVLSPLVILSNYVQGMNDGFVALCIGLACLCRKNRLFVLAGLLLGVGALMKFYPLLFAPFLALDRDRTMRFRLLIVAAGVFFAGMAVGFGIWGDPALSPFTFGAVREAKALSLARLIELTVCAAGAESVCEITTGKNVYLLLAVASALAVVTWARGCTWDVALVVAIPLIFFVYKVGHNQFLICWLAVLLFINLQEKSALRSRILLSAIPMLVYLSVLKIGYMLTGGTDGGGWDGKLWWVGEWMALPWLALLAGFIWSLREHLFDGEWRLPRLAI